MAGETTLSGALEREHREIDAGIEAYVASLAGTEPDLAALGEAMVALRRHIYLEEEFLFPPLRAAGLMAPVFVMLREHGELWDAMVAIDAALAADAGQDLSAACADLLGRLEAHNAKEEPIVYPVADREIDEEATAALLDLIATDTLPPGWVCAQATR
ncbi:hemerythrin domain-containing protein [Nocardioides sp. AE5]|uniref:hemerythrin domain-containing protein n=1 Tax=Nocardioides sp. AE5 TaxID=2962573 RepID=UPI00288165BB|nr:hemerythrin domain-containing protein [Nocardioides sp. AE5]MDT0202266.1 hemerythrin domain-containing protein [Nocardioides sp. AE5]